MTQVAAPPKTNTLALIGFIASFLVPIAGLVLGIVARQQLARPGSVETGAGFARWAIIVSTIYLVIQVIFVIVWLTVLLSILSGRPPGA